MYNLGQPEIRQTNIQMKGIAPFKFKTMSA